MQSMVSKKVATGTKIWIRKYVFFCLFWAKMTKIGIQNPKLIVTNDYQKFWAHFDWFLSLFQISDVKPELLPVLESINSSENYQKKTPKLYVLYQIMHIY